MTIEGISKLVKGLKIVKQEGQTSLEKNTWQLIFSILLPYWLNFFNTQSILVSFQIAGKFIPVYKKGDKNNLSNYRPVSLRPVSLTSIVCKLLERVIVSHISKHLSNILVDYQHGFRSGLSCTT